MKRVRIYTARCADGRFRLSCPTCGWHSDKSIAVGGLWRYEAIHRRYYHGEDVQVPMPRNRRPRYVPVEMTPAEALDIVIPSE